MGNRIDESLNEYLKRIYGTSVFRKKIIVEIKMELNHNNLYEIKEAYCPKEEIGLKIDTSSSEVTGGEEQTEALKGGLSHEATPFKRKLPLTKKGRDSKGRNDTDKSL